MPSSEIIPSTAPTVPVYVLVDVDDTTVVYAEGTGTAEAFFLACRPTSPAGAAEVAESIRAICERVGVTADAEVRELQAGEAWSLDLPTLERVQAVLEQVVGDLDRRAQESVAG